MIFFPDPPVLSICFWYSKEPCHWDTHNIMFWFGNRKVTSFLCLHLFGSLLGLIALNSFIYFDPCRIGHEDTFISHGFFLTETIV